MGCHDRALGYPRRFGGRRLSLVARPGHNTSLRASLAPVAPAAGRGGRRLALDHHGPLGRRRQRPHPRGDSRAGRRRAAADGPADPRDDRDHAPLRRLGRPRGHGRADGRRPGRRTRPPYSLARPPRHPDSAPRRCGRRLWRRLRYARGRDDLRARGAGDRPDAVRGDPALSRRLAHGRLDLHRLGHLAHALPRGLAPARGKHRDASAPRSGAPRVGGSRRRGLRPRRPPLCRSHARRAAGLPPTRGLPHSPAGDRGGGRGRACHALRHAGLSRPRRHEPRSCRGDDHRLIRAGGRPPWELAGEDSIHRHHNRLGLQGGGGDAAILRGGNAR